MTKTLIGLAGAIALLMFSASPAIGQPMSTPEKTMQPAQAKPGATDPEMAQFRKSAAEVQRHISSDPAVSEKFAAVVKARNEDEAKKLLAQYGFTDEQLKSAKINMVDRTGAGEHPAARKIVVTVSGTCCPPKIVIVIRF
jgi:hypothetical protein